MTIATELQVNRSNIRQHRVVQRSLAVNEGTALLRVDQFAVTANNVTYAAFGDMMSYWNFFPTGDDGWGIVPVWGFADVVESRCDGVREGERVYGYFPMSTHLVVEPNRVSTTAFSDGSAHRAALHAVYNSYLRTAADPGYSAELEDEQMLLRPLFTTSFLIDDFLADNDMFGAHTVLLSSASSKTAYGAAFSLHQREGLRVVGLTSPSNVEFVRALGCYDDVVAYDDLASLALVDSVYVDMSGSESVRRAVHSRLGDHLLYDCAVGGTHWDAERKGGSLPGPSPTMFFAPAQIAKRNAELGSAQFQATLATAWVNFLASVNSADAPWMTVVHGRGPESVGSTLAAHMGGTASPAEGHIVSMHP